MIVIGIDPGKYGFNAAVLRVDNEGSENLILLHTCNVEQKGFTLPSMILSKIHAQTVEMMFALQHGYPDEEVMVFCEEAVAAGARNLRTYAQLAMAVASILTATTLYTPKCYLVPVSKWKQGTVGSGTAGKDVVTLWLNRVYPSYAARCGASQDLVDACCIARYGLTVVADSALVGLDDSLGEI